MNSDGQMIGFHLQAPNLSTLQVIEPAPAIPLRARRIPIDKLLQSGTLHHFHPSHPPARNMSHCNGPDPWSAFATPTRGICAETSQAIPVAVGDLVDVAGFVETDNQCPRHHQCRLPKHREQLALLHPNR